jgi:hypothetical protein
MNANVVFDEIDRLIAIADRGADQRRRLIYLIATTALVVFLLLSTSGKRRNTIDARSAVDSNHSHVTNGHTRERRRRALVFIEFACRNAHLDLMWRRHDLRHAVGVARRSIGAAASVRVAVDLCASTVSCACGCVCVCETRNTRSFMTGVNWGSGTVFHVC